VLEPDCVSSVPLKCALAKTIAKPIMRATNRVTNGKAIHRLNSIGLTGSAMLDGLSRRCPRAPMTLPSDSWMSMCVISVML
jgi:hypothetical protein